MSTAPKMKPATAAGKRLAPKQPVQELRPAETASVKLRGAVPTKEPKLIADLPTHVKLAWEALQEAGFLACD